MTGSAMASEALIGVFAAMVGIVMIRRRTPRVVELAVWIGLLWACVLAIASAHNEQTRALTSAAVWGATQIGGTIVGLLEQGALRWMNASRFAIADWAVLIFGFDLLTLTLVSTWRKAQGTKPQVRLRDWIEMPRLADPRTAQQKRSTFGAVNRRLNVWAPVAFTAPLTRAALFLIKSRDVGIEARARGREARTGDGARQTMAAKRQARGKRIVEARGLTEGAGATTVQASRGLAEAVRSQRSARKRVSHETATTEGTRTSV